MKIAHEEAEVEEVAMTLKRESTPTEEEAAVAAVMTITEEAVAVITITVAEDPALHLLETTSEITEIPEEMTIAAEMTMVAIPVK